MTLEAFRPVGLGPENLGGLDVIKDGFVNTCRVASKAFPSCMQMKTFLVIPPVGFEPTTGCSDGKNIGQCSQG